MAVTVVKRRLSSMGANGLPINISSSLRSGIDLHTGPTSTAAHDSIYIYANNLNTSHTIDFFLHVGGANGTPVQSIFQVPANTFNYPVVEDYDVWGIGSTVRVMGGGVSQTGQKLYVYGHYVRYTES
jgi:hypothetical protein